MNLRKIVRPIASYAAQSAVFAHIINLSTTMAKFAPNPVFRAIYSIGGFVVGWVFSDKTAKLVEEYVDDVFDAVESRR